ncbi:MAG: thymidine phosphorylase [Alphaproteobacteria bacterium]|nr:thymidine phosphorylase [Alphaproteobacteria bacterium]
MMIPQEIIRRKRDKETLSAAEIRSFVAAIAEQKVDDAQIAALTMAIFLNGMNKDEVVDLTLAMRDSGDILQWKDIDKPIVDKHSSGGVGDKVSLMLAPILAACDVCVPMIAGRGLGHTGGTVDKLEAIPDYNTKADNTLFHNTVKNIGCAIIGQTGNLAPADKKIYAVRDVSATVESIPLITASILSKKLAAGLQYLVMDLKCGNGAFMENYDQAYALAQSIVDVANGAGTTTKAVITDMNQVLGTTAGNAVEIIETLDYLQNKNVNPRLDEIVKTLCATLLVQCGRFSDSDSAKQQIANVISSGYAMEKFAKMVSALGGPVDFVENSVKYLPHANYVKPIFAPQEGYISAMDTRAVGLSIIELKGGRTITGQQLDLATGYSDFVQIGAKVDKQTPLAMLHCQSNEQYIKAQKALYNAISISDEKPIIKTPIMQVI